MGAKELASWLARWLESASHGCPLERMHQSIHTDETERLCTLSANFSQHSADPSCPQRSVRVQFSVWSLPLATLSDQSSDDSWNGGWPLSQTPEVDVERWSL